MSTYALAVATQLAREPLPATGEEQLAYLLLDVRATMALPPRPVNIAFVIDRSASMNARRMEQVKQGIAEVIDRLGPQDILTVIAFDDLVQKIIPAQAVTDRANLKSMIETLDAGGGTLLSVGMSLAMAEMLPYASPERSSRMIILSDGKTNNDEAECLLLAENARLEGISLVTLGLGSEWDVELLTSLSERSGGQYPVYLRTPAEIVPTFVAQVDAARATLYNSMCMEITCSPGVLPVRVTRVSPYMAPLPVSDGMEPFTFSLGDIEHDVPHLIVLELLIAPKRGGTFRVARIAVKSLLDGDEEPLLVNVTATFSGNTTKQPKLRPLVIHYVRYANAARLVLQALRDGPPATQLNAGILQSFNARARQLLQLIWSGQTLTPEQHKLIFEHVRGMASIKRTEPAKIQGSV